MIKTFPFPWRKKPTNTVVPDPAASRIEPVGLAPAPAAPGQATVGTESLDDTPPHYPPSDKGVPVESIDRILEKNKPLVARISRAAGVTVEQFEVRYMAPIRNLAAYVQLLPATDGQYFDGPGGLLRMSLEIALHALQTATGSVFPTVGAVDKRTAMLPRWELACFLAGLCSQLYRPITNLVVTDHANRQWPTLTTPMQAWSEEIGASRYYIRWTSSEDRADHQSCSIYLINKIIPFEVLHFLNTDNNVILPAMTAAVSCSDLVPSENPIGKIVAPITTRVIKEDILHNCRNYGRYAMGIHLEPRLIDAMRRLLKSGKWSVNSKGARVWVGKEGAFVIWGAASKEIIGLLTADSFVGLPQDPDTLADILIDANVLQPYTDGGRYWPIVLPEAGTLIENAVRLTSELILFAPKTDLTPYKSVTLAGTKEPAPVDAKAAAAAPKPKGGKAKVKPDGENGKSSPQEAEAASAKPGKQVQLSLVPPALEKEKPPRKTPKPKGQEATSDADAGLGAVQVGGQVVSQPATEQVKTIPPEELVHEDDGKDIYKNLSRESGWIMKQIVKATKVGKLTGVVVNLEHGVGISEVEYGSHGMPTDNLLTELSDLNWLWVDPSRRLRKIHRIEVAGSVETMMIVSAPVSQRLGFEWIAPQ